MNLNHTLLSIDQQIEIENRTVGHILALQDAKRELLTLYSSLHRLSPDLGKVVLELERSLELRCFGSRQGLENIGIHTGRVLELCLSLLLVTLRVGTPSNSPFDVRLAWLEKLQNLPFFQTASPRLHDYLAKWSLPVSSLIVMRLISSPSPSTAAAAAAARRNSLDPAKGLSGLSELRDEEPVDARVRICSIRQTVEEVVRLLFQFDDLQGLLQAHISDYCGLPPTGSKHCSKLCCFSIDGKCMRPDGQCPYAHSYEQIRAQLLPVPKMPPIAPVPSALSGLLAPPPPIAAPAPMSIPSPSLSPSFNTSSSSSSSSSSISSSSVASNPSLNNTTTTTNSAASFSYSLPPIFSPLNVASASTSTASSNHSNIINNNNNHINNNNNHNHNNLGQSASTSLTPSPPPSVSTSTSSSPNLSPSSSSERSHPVPLLSNPEQHDAIMLSSRTKRNAGSFDSFNYQILFASASDSSSSASPASADSDSLFNYAAHSLSDSPSPPNLSLSDLNTAFSTDVPFSPRLHPAPLPPQMIHQDAVPRADRHSWPAISMPPPSAVGDRPSSMSQIEMFEDDDEMFDETNLPPHRRKTIICRHWRRSFCRLGTNCNFAHGSDDLAPSVRKFCGTTIPPPPPLRRHPPLPPYI